MNTTEDNSNPDLMPAIPGQPNPIALPVRVESVQSPGANPPTAAQLRVVEVGEALAPAYQKASTLELTDAEVEALQAPFPDELVEIRPHDGLIYLPHIHVSNRLNKVFRPGKWALIRRREWMEAGVMYGEYVLLIRGCYVGESIGGHPYIANNPKTNYSDALESTAAEALRRIAGKRLSCGDLCWQPEYARQWVAKYAEQVGGKWRKKAPAASQTHSAPAPPSTTAPVAKNAPERQPEAKTPAVATDKIKARMIELLEPVRAAATEYLVKIGWLMDNETLEDLSLSRVPTTKPEMDALMNRIQRFSDGDEAEEPDQTVLEGSAVSGFIRVVTQKPTSKGGIRYGVLLVSDMDQKDGGVWCNTFDDNDGKAAVALKGKSVSVLVKETKFGKDIIKGSIKEL